MLAPQHPRERVILARPGRQPISPEKASLVVLLLNTGVLSDCEIGRRLRIDDKVVGRMRKGHERFDDEGRVVVLNPGEFFLDEPLRCPGPCRQRVTIFPCRICGGCPTPGLIRASAAHVNDHAAAPPEKRRQAMLRQLSLLDEPFELPPPGSTITCGRKSGPRKKPRRSRTAAAGAAGKHLLKHFGRPSERKK